MSNETKHTSGPWRVVQGCVVLTHHKFPLGHQICSTRNAGVSEDEAKANAHLIAAAPEMLEALKYVRRFIDKDDEIDIDFIDSAIAKAEGN